MKDIFNKFIHWGLCQNYWGWFHALMGGIAYAIFHKLFHWNSGISLLMVFLGAIVWELYEYWRDKNNMNEIYQSGGFEQFLYDAAGDIFLAVSVAYITILGQ